MTSEGYEYETQVESTVQLTAVAREEHEILQLGDFLGRVPVREVVEVLDSWGVKEGWVPVEPGRIYRRGFAGGVEVEMRIGDDGTVRLVRRASDQVVSEQADARAAELAAAVRQAQPQVIQSLHAVAVRAIGKAIPHQIGSIKGVVLKTVEEELAHRYVVETYAYVPVKQLLEVRAHV